MIQLPWKNGIISIICGAVLALHVWLTGRIVQHFAEYHWCCEFTRFAKKTLCKISQESNEN
ncbi:MAG TPA: hypothetical protein VGI33_19005 [Paenibacillus sp.]